MGSFTHADLSIPSPLVTMAEVLEMPSNKKSGGTSGTIRNFSEVRTN